MLQKHPSKKPPMGLDSCVMGVFYTDDTPMGFRTIAERFAIQMLPLQGLVFLKEFLKQRRGFLNRAFAYFCNASRQSAIRFCQHRDFLADSRLLMADCYFKMTIFRMVDVSSVSSW